jgi:hypothetical protein
LPFSHDGARLGDLLGPAPAPQHREPGLGARDDRFGLLNFVTEWHVVQPREFLPAIHRIAFIHRHRCDPTRNPETKVNLTNIHVAVEA